MKKLTLLLTFLVTTVTLFAIEKDTTSIADYILGDLTFNKLVAASFFCFLGLMTTMLIDYIFSVSRQLIKEGKVDKFQGRFWVHDNKKRIIFHILLNIIVMFTVFVFFPEFSGKELQMYHAWIIGISFDTVIIIIRRFTKINTFQITPEKIQEIAQKNEDED